ncbi:hypothetical protein GCM10027275_10030 [Rhabdobacter roseus]|uniref:Uncharacterized protein n=1 Tax=Rhabdobacter roseus TaxID=1655419 RepID=A0A840TMC5_9BACT|nr:hypothetical protein [Rhabdobacter roseus]MBB5282907.1 hypothetical protein [Rhabdobacter roseus]
MTDPLLQMHLPAVMLVAIGLTLCWKQVRKMTGLRKLPDVDRLTRYHRLRRVRAIYWICFFVFALMTGIYSMLPRFYFLFLPLDLFHHPLINSVGLLVLKVSIVWIVIAQIHIDKELYKYSRAIDSLPAMELVRYSEKILLSGMLVLFIGFFVTITNVIGLILVAISWIAYGKAFYGKKRVE